MLPGEKQCLVDNHNSVLKPWDQYNVHQGTCIHLEAHLDCSWTAKEEKIDFSPVRIIQIGSTKKKR